MQKHQLFTGPQGSGKTTKVREIAAQFQPDQVAFVDFYPPNIVRQMMKTCSAKTALIVIEGYYHSIHGDDTATGLIMAVAANGLGFQKQHVLPKIIITSQVEICEGLTDHPKFSELFETVKFPEAETEETEI